MNKGSFFMIAQYLGAGILLFYVPDFALGLMFGIGLSFLINTLLSKKKKEVGK